MMILQTYAGLSFFAVITMICHAFGSREQFYPAMVYLSTSKISLVLFLNMGLVLMCILWKIVKFLFLGTLRDAEVEGVNDQLWREIMEITLATTIFRHDFSVATLVMVVTLLMIKSLHWLAQKRVDYIATTPSVSLRSHIRIVSFLVFLLLVDCISLSRPLRLFIQTRKPSIALFFLFDYTFLASTTISTLVKYAFHVKDMSMEGQWEKKAVYVFYMDLIRDLFNLSLYIIYFFVIFKNYGFPIHLIRQLCETLRGFKIRIADYIRYCKVTSNVNERFPNATPEELNADATCIICREEMLIAKRLCCGHIFHAHCLRSWLERQNFCPTCRALAIPPENGAAESREQARPQEAGTYMQGSEAIYLSPHQARIQAASVAASLYERSFGYSPATTYLGSLGFPTNHENTAVSLVPGCSFTDDHGAVSTPYPSVRHGFSQSRTETQKNESEDVEKLMEDKSEVIVGDTVGNIADVKGKAIVDAATVSNASL